MALRSPAATRSRRQSAPTSTTRATSLWSVPSRATLRPLFLRTPSRARRPTTSSSLSRRTGCPLRQSWAAGHCPLTATASAMTTTPRSRTRWSVPSRGLSIQEHSHSATDWQGHVHGAQGRQRRGLLRMCFLLPLLTSVALTCFSCRGSMTLRRTTSTPSGTSSSTALRVSLLAR